MAVLDLPKQTIVCPKCGRKIVVKESNGYVRTLGILSQDDKGPYVQCLGCGRKVYYTRREIHAKRM